MQEWFVERNSEDDSMNFGVDSPIQWGLAVESPMQSSNEERNEMNMIESKF
jgi:hypothetical protein